MYEEILCKPEYQPKILKYYDKITKQCVEVTFRLSKNITSESLHWFFNKLYMMKLEQGYSSSLKKNYNTRDLINCFETILYENDVISLQKIYNILNKKLEYNSNPAEQAIEEFFKMFEVIAFKKYPEIEEPKSIDYNGALVELKTKPKVKIKVKRDIQKVA